MNQFFRRKQIAPNRVDDIQIRQIFINNYTLNHMFLTESIEQRAIYVSILLDQSMQYSICQFKVFFTMLPDCKYMRLQRAFMCLQSPVACFLVITTTEASEYCKNTPCQNSGECVPSFRCACPSGWGGEYCNGKVDS